MVKRVLVSGAFGFLVLMIWTFVVNGIFGLTLRTEMKQIPAERIVYQVLKEHIASPGVYVVNPALMPEGGFPPGEPVFSVRYSGFEHGLAGRMAIVEPALVLIAAVLVAWLLSMTSSRVLASYAHKVAFVFAVGLVHAVSKDLGEIGIGGNPAYVGVILAANRVASWTLAGLVMARTMKGSET